MMKAFQFLKRDFLIDISYRLKFALQLGGIFLSTLMFFFMDKLVGPGVANQMEAYGGRYFGFVLIGVALTDYLSVSLGSFAGEVRKGQVMGTLEALLVTPTSVPVILLSSSLYSFCLTSFRVVLYLVCGALLFGLELRVGSFAAALLLLLLTIVSVSGIGLLSAAFIVVFKEGSPITMLVSVGSGLLGGVFFPVAVLPGWLQPVSYLLPITHALEGLRQTLLAGAGFAAVAPQMGALLLFAAVLLPLGLWSFSMGLHVARREGTLLHY